jgi:transcriptional regulator with XRE-family HTH domain
MNFGNRVRQLRKESGLTQRELADRLAVTISYVSKVENGKLHHGDFPSEKFIHKLAHELEADEDELLLLADKVPQTMRQRIQERPDAFRQFAELDDKTMDAVLGSMKKQMRKQ